LGDLERQLQEQRAARDALERQLAAQPEAEQPCALEQRLQEQARQVQAGARELAGGREARAENAQMQETLAAAEAGRALAGMLSLAGEELAAAGQLLEEGDLQQGLGKVLAVADRYAQEQEQLLLQVRDVRLEVDELRRQLQPAASDSQVTVNGESSPARFEAERLHGEVATITRELLENAARAQRNLEAEVREARAVVAQGGDDGADSATVAALEQLRVQLWESRQQEEQVRGELRETAAALARAQQGYEGAERRVQELGDQKRLADQAASQVHGRMNEFQRLENEARIAASEQLRPADPPQPPPEGGAPQSPQEARPPGVLERLQETGEGESSDSGEYF